VARARNQRLLTEDEVAARRHELLDGVEQYNSGYFFQAHETWEDLWLLSPHPYRPFLQGLIQVAAAFVHLSRRQYPGTVRLLGEALAKLDNAPPGLMGIDVALLREEVRRAKDALELLGPERFEDWDRSGIPRMRLRAGL
jgi:predicted metal-dependent hydrolase